MAFKFVILCALIAYTQAGIIGAPAGLTYHAPALAYQSAGPALAYATPTLTSQSSNIYRSPGNLGQISTYSKTIDTPYSSVSKSDVRISNPGLKTIGVAYSAAPAVSHFSYDSGLVHYAF